MLKKNKGFTLIELMVTVAIVGILLGLGVPSLTNYLKDRRIENQTRALFARFQAARYEAVSRGQIVALEQTGGSLRMFVDVNGDGNFDGGDTLLKLWDDDFAGIDVDVTDDLSLISFRANGMLNSGGIIQLALCDDRGVNSGQLLTLNIAGQVSYTDAVSCSL